MVDLIIKGTSLVKYNGDEKHIVIPAEIREIKPGAFKGTKIETIDFSFAINLFVIGEEAFSHCTQLKYVELPVGLKEIGNRAFSGCDNLNYVYIPDTTSAFGKDIFADLSKVIIVGEDDSRGKRFAESNTNCIFRTDYENVKHSAQILEQKKSEVARQEFNVFGVIIECSNTCAIYSDTITHYQELIRKESLFKTLRGCFPTKIDKNAGADRYLKALENSISETNRRLSRYGILTKDGESGTDVMSIHERLLKVYGGYLSLFTNAIREGNSKAFQISEELYQEAKDNATGLNYGVIGGFGDLIAYDIDNFLTKNRQLNANLEKARRQSTDVFNSTITGIEASAKEALEELTPTLREWVNELLGALCQFELTMMEEAGVIDKDLNDAINPNKSRKYFKLISDQPDGLQNAGMALRYDPLNKDVYNKLIWQGSDNDDLYKLAKFVGLADYYSAAVKGRIQNLINQDDFRGVLVSIEEYGNRLSENARLSIDQLLADKYSLKIKELVEGDYDTAETPYDYCAHKLNSVYDKDIFNYLNNKRVVSSNQIVDWSWDYDGTLEHIVQVRERKQKEYKEIQDQKGRKYEEVKELIQSDELTDLNKAMTLLNEIRGFKDSAELSEKTKELLKKNNDYSDLVSSIEFASSVSEYEQIKSKLEGFGNYKDSKRLIEKCQATIDTLKERETNERLERERMAEAASRKRKTIFAIVIVLIIVCVVLAIWLTKTPVQTSSSGDNDGNSGSTVNTTSQSEQAEKDDKETTDDQNANSNGSGYENITSGQLRAVLNERFDSELDVDVTDVSDQTFYGQGYGQLSFTVGPKASFSFVRTQINDEGYDYDSKIDYCVFFIEKDENAIDCMAIVASSIYEPFTKEAAKEDIISLLDQAEAHKTGSTAQIEWKQYDEWNLLCGDSGDVYCCAVFPAGMKPDEILKMAGVRL